VAELGKAGESRMGEIALMRKIEKVVDGGICTKKEIER